MTAVHGSENFSVYHHGLYWGMMSKNILFIHLRNCAINLLINSPLVLLQFSHCEPENLGLFGLMSVYFLYVLWSAHCCKKAFSNFIESHFLNLKSTFGWKWSVVVLLWRFNLLLTAKFKTLVSSRHFFLILQCLYHIESEKILPINQSPKILLVMVWRNHYHY